MLTDQLERIRYGGDEAFVKRLSLRGLLPETDHYMTYDGSTTAPACPETVTWLVLNKPIYITKQQVIYNFNSIFSLYEIPTLFPPTISLSVYPTVCKVYVENWQ